MPFTKRYGPILGRFLDFSRGEYGSTNPRRATAGQFTGQNVFVYLDGSIGPRPGMPDQSPALLAGSVPTNFLAFGVGRSISTVWGIDTNGDAWWTSQPLGGDQWFKFPHSLATHPTGLDWVDDGPNTFVASLDDSLYVLDLSGHDLRALIGAPDGGTAITRFGEHLVTGGATATSRQLRWSDPNNFDSWPALNFLNLGNIHDRIESLQVQKNVLIVTMIDGRMFQITGTLGVNEVVREFSSNAPRGTRIAPHRVNQTKRSIIWRKGRVFEPESFDGTQLHNIAYLDQWMRTELGATDFIVTAGPQEDDVCFVGGQGGALLLHHDAWTQHRFPPSALEQNPVLAFYDGNTLLAICRNFGVSGPSVYTLDLGVEHPALQSLGQTTEDDLTGHAPVAFFTTPDIRDSAGRGLHIRLVNVRFTKYLTGGVDNNHFDVTLNLVDQYESEQPVPNTHADVFDEDPALATVAGVQQQKMFAFDPGGDIAAASVTIGNLVGCTINEIIVYGTIETDRSVT